MIGGARRNVGKTTLLCNIISQYAKSNQIVGLKIKTINKDDHFFHGKDSGLGNQLYDLYDESDLNTGDDSSKMIQAGAVKAYRLKTHFKNLEQSFLEFMKIVPKHVLIVCESNSLRAFFEPDLFLFLKHEKEEDMKPSAEKLVQLADKIVFTDGARHSINQDEIKVTDMQWFLHTY